MGTRLLDKTLIFKHFKIQMPLKNLDDRKAYARASYVAKRAEKLAAQKRYYQENRDKVIAREKRRYQKNRAEIRAQQKKYYDAHKVNRNRRQKKRRKEDINFRLRYCLANRVRMALKRNQKSAKTLELLGCTIEFLRGHLENQFIPGMTWENYGTAWQVDHILPCAEFHLQHSEEQEVCFHWTNLQPLFATDNLSKSDRII